jgi:hypothetical protein
MRNDAIADCGLRISDCRIEFIQHPSRARKQADSPSTDNLIVEQASNVSRERRGFEGKRLKLTGAAK